MNPLLLINLHLGSKLCSTKNKLEKRFQSVTIYSNWKYFKLLVGRATTIFGQWVVFRQIDLKCQNLPKTLLMCLIYVDSFSLYISLNKNIYPVPCVPFMWSIKWRSLIPNTTTIVSAFYIDFMITATKSTESHIQLSKADFAAITAIWLPRLISSSFSHLDKW